MKYLDCTFPAPAENLAWEEAYLDGCESGAFGELLRFYASTTPFVVVGYANKTASEVNLDECAKAGVGVYRRMSGGGTVLQGPGCLSYALFLRIASHPKLATITSTNHYIMAQNCAALAEATGLPVTIQGHTDLAIGGRKFSGNAQRRKKTFVLFHGTIMHGMDIAAISRFLRMPSLEPEYRSGRGHGDFLMNLNLPEEMIKQSLRKIWLADEEMANPFPAVASELVCKYNSPEWIHRTEQS